MAVSLDLSLALIQILKSMQQTLSTLKMKEDQQKVYKALKILLYKHQYLISPISVLFKDFSLCSHQLFKWIKLVIKYVSDKTYD